MNGSQFHDRHFTDAPLAGVSTTPASPVVFEHDISGFYSSVHSWANLAALSTVLASVNSIVEWYDTSASLMRTTVLLTSTEATDTSQGMQRPDDYNGSTNAKVWYQIGGAG
jgi:hypothetical protein